VDRAPVPKRNRGRLSSEAATELSDLARELRRRRELLGLSQVALAQVSGMSQTVINRVEAGARVPTDSTYARLRAALGLKAPPTSLIATRQTFSAADEGGRAVKHDPHGCESPNRRRGSTPFASPASPLLVVAPRL
jgi:transcriptional regulator with XRE-family HTH domain